MASLIDVQFDADCYAIIIEKRGFGNCNSATTIFPPDEPDASHTAVLHFRYKRIVQTCTETRCQSRD